MIRSYTLTLASVTLRVWLPLGIGMELSFTDAHQAVSWVSWGVVAEWVVLRKGVARSPSVGAVIAVRPSSAAPLWRGAKVKGDSFRSVSVL